MMIKMLERNIFSYFAVFTPWEIYKDSLKSFWMGIIRFKPIECNVQHTKGSPDHQVDLLILGLCYLKELIKYSVIISFFFLIRFTDKKISTKGDKVSTGNYIP